MTSGGASTGDCCSSGMSWESSDWDIRISFFHWIVVDILAAACGRSSIEGVVASHESAGKAGRKKRGTCTGLEHIDPSSEFSADYREI